MEIDQFTQLFFKMETEQGLFSQTFTQSEPLWDIVRSAVFTSLFGTITRTEQPQVMPQVTRRRSLPWAYRRIRALQKSWSNLRRLGKADFLCFVCSRYSGEFGAPIDFAAQNAVQMLARNGLVQVLESHYGLNEHLNVPVLTGIIGRLQQLPSQTEQLLQHLCNCLRESESSYFGLVDPDLKKVVRQAYREYLAGRSVWRRVISQSHPRLILMTQNGIQKALIREAHSFRIPIVECQHGIIHRNHPSYSYPTELTAQSALLLPDALLIFSEFWRSQCHMPGTQIITVGNDYFYCGEAQSTREGPAVFIDAGVFHQYLSPIAVDVAKSMPDRRFIMKLHPSQIGVRDSIVKEYSGIPNLSVAGPEVNLHDLLRDASDVITLQSTVSYEALDRGIPVHLLETAGYFRSHQHILARDDVRLSSTSDHLRNLLFKSVRRPETTELFFEPFCPDEFWHFLRQEKII